MPVPTEITAYDGLTLLKNASPVDELLYYYDALGNTLRMYTGLSSPLTITGLDAVSGSDSSYSVTRYAYDRFANMATMTDPLSQTESYTYDLNGNQLTKTDRNGNVTTYACDDLDRLVSSAVDTPDDAGDAAGAIAYTLTGLKRSESNDTGTTTYNYDALGRTTQESFSGTGSNTVKTYAYNIGGNRTSFALSVGGVSQFGTTYTYDALNRLTGMTEGATTATYGYDTNGNRSYVQYNNGLRDEYHYNLANLLTTLTNKNSGGTVLSAYTYTYTLDGNQINKTDHTGKVNTYTI